MTHIERNIRAECSIEKLSSDGWRCFKVNGKGHVWSSSLSSLKSSLEIHVRHRKRDVREAAALLRRYGFAVTPPSRANTSREA